MDSGQTAWSWYTMTISEVIVWLTVKSSDDIMVHKLLFMKIVSSSLNGSSFFPDSIEGSFNI